MVWTIPSPCPSGFGRRRDLDATRLVSTPSRFRAWLGIATCEGSPSLGGSTSPVSRSALKFFSSPLRLPVSPRPLEKGIYSGQKKRSQVKISIFHGGGHNSLLEPRPPDADGGGIKTGFDVRGAVFLDHPDAGAAVSGDPINIGPPPSGAEPLFSGFRAPRDGRTSETRAESLLEHGVSEQNRGKGHRGEAVIPANL